MGPRRWGRGRPRLRERTQARLRLQWGRDDGVAEDAGVRRHPMDRRWSLQWGRDDGVAEDPDRLPSGRATIRFNGAATMGSRKTDHSRSRDAADARASMGPRRWGRGRRSGPAMTGDRRQLQWGRDDGVAEDPCEYCDVRPSSSASMGPRRWGRGRRRARALPRAPRSQLQWGRDDGVAEDAVLARVRSTPEMLQWGRDDGVAEDRGHGSQRRDPRPLQWGRDDGVAEERQCRLAIRPDRRASMGPRRWGRGRRRRRMIPGMR